MKSAAIGANFAMKFSEDGLYSLNENGLHYYSKTTEATISQSIFSITNCGIVFNETA
jgi:WD40 repeat protein